MPKTDLTKRIEQAILEWHPAKIGEININTSRREHTALEVVATCGTTSGGIVDAVRVSEYFGDIKSEHICRPSSWRKDGIRANLHCNLGYDTMRPLPLFCNQTDCKWNGVSQVGQAKVLLTCFEIKVTKSDFHSEHGHNFIGNLNFYAVPQEIYKEVEAEVPQEIGILAYYNTPHYNGLRTKRKAVFREMDEESQKWLILSVLKRIRDMDYKKYREWCENYKRSMFHE